MDQPGLCRKAVDGPLRCHVLSDNRLMWGPLLATEFQEGTSMYPYWFVSPAAVSWNSVMALTRCLHLGLIIVFLCCE